MAPAPALRDARILPWHRHPVHPASHKSSPGPVVGCQRIAREWVNGATCVRNQGLRVGWRLLVLESAFYPEVDATPLKMERTVLPQLFRPLASWELPCLPLIVFMNVFIPWEEGGVLSSMSFDHELWPRMVLSREQIYNKHLTNKRGNLLLTCSLHSISLGIGTFFLYI